MLFNSVAYLLFLPTVVGLYWLIGRRFRPLLLLVASYFFYMSWLAKYGLLLAFLTVANYSIGLFIAKRKISENQRLAAFVIGLSINLACLVVFKYTNFLMDSAWHSLSFVWQSWFHLDFFTDTPPQAHILLPLGISFFVFEFIHYLSDVYGGSYAMKNPVSFGLFAAFFPSQIAGPIKRYEDFDAQLHAEHPFDLKLFHAGCWLIVEGMFKKVVLGDNLAPIVQQGFSQPHSLASADAWLCAIAFALQIYYDFSGYTDIGRGSAMLFGFRLPENFNKPYLATSLIDFWHRWHISLSTWLRDYLYKPLGGSRHGQLPKYRNLLITMLLGGLWHGASWHYVLWGAFHGLGLIGNHAWRQLKQKRVHNQSATQPLISAAASITTLLFVLLGWVLFRAHSSLEALTIYTAMFTWHSGETSISPCFQLLFNGALPAGFLLYGFFQLAKHFAAAQECKLETEKRAEPAYLSLSWWLSPTKALELTSYLAWSIVVVGLAARTANPFIYFQF